MRAVLVGVVVLTGFAQALAAQQARVVRPDKSAGPTRVDVSIAVVEVSAIEDAEETFEVDFVPEARWRDPRLSWDQADDPEASVVLYDVDLTKADVFILGCTLIVFLALAHAVASGRVARSGREALAQRMDRVGRWVYVVVFAGVFVVELNW